jgi:predicted ABC-type ATPase
MDRDRPKNLVVIGGPNGAGKTTWAVNRLPATLGITEFVNADEIARGLSPLNPGSTSLLAGRVMLDRMHALVDAGDSFAFETTCAGRGHASRIKLCRSAGYRIMLVYLWLPSPQDAIVRVARRVEQGGHHIPDDIVIRRYSTGLRNLRRLYLPLADVAIIFDNSDGSEALIAERRYDGPFIIFDEPRWGLIEEATR